MIKNIKLTIEYDGTDYAGWQKQREGGTLQQEIETALSSLTKEDIKVTGSSRTDSGVHAKGYVCNFKTSSTIPSEKFARALNSKLPDDIIIIKSEEVDLEFHSRYDSKGKTYSYTVLNRLQAGAMYRNYMYHVSKKINIELMREAGKYLIGTHDFAAFKNSGSNVSSTVRTIMNIEIIRRKHTIKFFITGDGFLYNMVRIIVGTLIEVGIGKIEPTYIKDILVSKDRHLAGKTAPARGLCLEKVYYEELSLNQSYNNVNN